MRAKQSALLLPRVASLAVAAKSNAVEPSDLGSRVAHVDDQQTNRGTGAPLLLWKYLRSIGMKNRTSSSSGITERGNSESRYLSVFPYS